MTDPPTRATRRAVLVFVRAPVAGTVKTRLARSVGDETALRLYRRLGETAVRAALETGAAVRVHHTPDDAASLVRGWLGERVTLLGQDTGDLGDRMARAFSAAFAEGFTRVLIVGSDLPEITPGLLLDGFAALDRRSAVLGPAADGGYWLLGLREPAPSIFREMAWSTARVFEETRRRLAAAGRDPALLPVLRDVDEVEDLPAGWLDQR